MHLFQKISHYPGIHTLARKNLLGMNLMSMREYFPDEFNFFPLTWMLPQ
jgi:tubulin polyglutamylase TTLL6/13